MTDHIEELAELHALGILDPVERDLVDTHVAQCRVCLRRLGRAEQVVAKLESVNEPSEAPSTLSARLKDSLRVATMVTTPRRRPDVSMPLSLALAFALALGLLAAGSLWQGSRMRSAMDSDDMAFSAIAGSHFQHAPFLKMQTDAPTAKVLYSKKAGSWLYVVADSANPNLTVFAQGDGVNRELGTLRVHQRAATLFIDHPGKLAVLTIVDQSSKPLERARLR
ncbi:MAG: hypothetical protein GIW99_05875 [Candidatus Eremiobacteraeota bacterium]|nr:hypothetical protein [Candidatus Eremiobacteraeota bacterium]MBC5827197.1 hypothetical protein [Candidatus Eremiobacteraeota bacterium]